MGNQQNCYKQDTFAKEQLIRVDSKNDRELLHRSLGALTFIDKDGQMGFGNAVQISKDCILTAAHNIYNRKHKADNSEFRLYFGKNRAYDNYHQIETWKYPEEFKNCWEEEKLHFDFAIMKLSDPIVFDKYLGLSIPCPECVWQKQLSLFGIPIFTQQSMTNLVYQYGLSRTGRVGIIDKACPKMGYQISIGPGQSGCPVVMDKSIIAIHLGGGTEYNIGRKVDSFLLDKMLSWSRKLNVSSIGLRQRQACPHQINFSSRGLQSFDLLDHSNLLHLSLASNLIRQIDLSHCSSLLQLNLSLNQLNFIDLAFNVNLTRLQLCSNNLQKIEHLSPKITYLDLRVNKLTIIDLQKSTKLEALLLHRNNLNFVDLSKNTHLSSLDISNNNLSTINLINNCKLCFIWLQYNQITEIGLRNNNAVYKLSLSNNCLTSISFCNNLLLRQLYLHANYLTSVRFRIAANATAETYTGRNQYGYFNFSLSQQQSSTCRVQLRCDVGGDKDKAVNIIEKWNQKYSQKYYNEHNCQYLFNIT